MRGEGSFAGSVSGRAVWYARTRAPVMTAGSGIEAERARFFAAAKTAKEQLALLAEEAEYVLGRMQADLFLVHRMLLEDVEYLEEAERLLALGYSAEAAVAEAEQTFVRQMEAVEDAYFRERAADIRDISERMLGILTQKEARLPLTGGAVLLAKELFPSEILQIAAAGVAAIVTEQGSRDSHMAVFASFLNIPAVFGTGEGLAVFDGHTVTVCGDGKNAEVYMQREAKV